MKCCDYRVGGHNDILIKAKRHTDRFQHYSDSLKQKRDNGKVFQSSPWQGNQTSPCLGRSVRGRRGSERGEPRSCLTLLPRPSFYIYLQLCTAYPLHTTLARCSVSAGKSSWNPFGTLQCKQRQKLQQLTHHWVWRQKRKMDGGIQWKQRHDTSGISWKCWCTTCRTRACKPLKLHLHKMKMTDCWLCCACNKTGDFLLTWVHHKPGWMEMVWHGWWWWWCGDNDTSASPSTQSSFTGLTQRFWWATIHHGRRFSVWASFLIPASLHHSPLFPLPSLL